jgi:ankyrin repeat protein
MALRDLPEHPDLDQLKRQAKELLQGHRDGKLSAAGRIVGHHPKLRDRPPIEVLREPFTLADAQLTLAREYGYPSWAKLKFHVDAGARLAGVVPHPGFAEALAALRAGDAERLRALLRADPSLVQARSELEPPMGYFTGATLLHHVAGNPYHAPLSPNVVEIARLLIEAGADVNAETIANPGGASTMGLIITSAHCSEAGFSGELMDLLLAHGARLDLKSPRALHDAIANYGFRAADRMIELGAHADLLAAAALGRMDLLHGFFDGTGRLTNRPRKNRNPLSERDAIGLAMLHAYVAKRTEAVDLLLAKDGNWNMIGVNNGTALHRAMSGGDRAMVERLVARGADLNDRNNPFCATPISWTDHVGHMDDFRWVAAHYPVDLHDAVCFDLPDHVIARLDEDPRRVNLQIDQWNVPHSTALRWAAWCKRPHLAQLLLERGANPNLISGDGSTALEAAERKGADDLAAIIRAHGGKRAADL